EARIAVDIAGDEVAAAGRFVHIPEEWERAWRNRRGVTRVAQIASVILLVLLYLAGAVFAIVRWSRHQFASSTFAIFFAFMAIVGGLQIFNSFRTASAQFVTAQPFKLQTAILIVGGLIATTGIAAVSSLLIGLAHRLVPEQPGNADRATLAAGFGLGALLAALGSVGMSLVPSTMPSWPDLSSAGDFLPLLGTAFGTVTSWITGSALFLLAVLTLNTATGSWRRRKLFVSTVLVLFGLVVTGSEGVESIPIWLVEGGLTGVVLLAVWVLVLRHHPALVPAVTAAGSALGAFHEAIIRPYPGAAAGSVIGGLAVVAAAWWWNRRLTLDSRFQPEGISVPETVDQVAAMEEDQ
ncbi:MAG: hypothetical protein P8127_07640, partial [Acidobacteriota bacterium]